MGTFTQIKQYCFFSVSQTKENLPLVAYIFQVMEREAKLMRQNGPMVFAQANHIVGIPEIAQHILQTLKAATIT